MGWGHGKGVIWIFTEGKEMDKGGSWLLPAPRISQWSWTFPRCGPCVMDSGNRNVALGRGNSLVSIIDQVWGWGYGMWLLSMGNRKQFCSQQLPKWPGIWGSPSSTSWITVLSPKGQRKAWDANLRIPFPLQYTHWCAHTCTYLLLETILALIISHFSDLTSHMYWHSKVRDSQECLPMLSHPRKTPGNHKGRVPLNVRSIEKKSSHHPWSLLNL